MAACGGDSVSLILQEGLRSTVWELRAGTGMRKVIDLDEQTDAVYTQVSRGLVHAAAVDSGGTLYTWGHHRYGVGRGASQRVATVQGQGITMVACGRHCVVALAQSGRVSTAGLVPFFNPADSEPPGLFLSLTYQNALQPMHALAFGGERIAMVAAGTQHFLAVSHDGRVFAWGRNRSGCLGLGNQLSQPRPVLLPPAVFGDEPVRVVCAFDNASMAVTRAGVLFACGNNASRVLGLADCAGVDVLVPTRVGGADVFGTGVLCVSGGAHHALAVSRGGLLFACGHSVHGALGLGPATDTAEAFTMIHPARFQSNLIVSASAGFSLSVAVSEVGSLFVWGCGAMGIQPLGARAARAKRVRSLPFLHDQYPCGNYHELPMPRVLALLMGTHARLGNWSSAAANPKRSSPRRARDPAPAMPAMRDSVLLQLPVEIMQALVRACAHWQPTSDAVEVLMGGGLRRP